MRGVIAKRLRELAQARTIGASKERTHLEYKKLKLAYKRGKTAAGHIPSPLGGHRAFNPRGLSVRFAPGTP